MWDEKRLAVEQVVAVVVVVAAAVVAVVGVVVVGIVVVVVVDVGVESLLTRMTSLNWRRQTERRMMSRFVS